MLIAKAKFLSLVFIGLICCACGANTAVTTTSHPTQTPVATETGTAVAQIIPTITPTAIPTLGSTQTHTPPPTATHMPTTTATAQKPFPEWVADPETNVLLLGDYPDTLIIFNAETGEMYEMTVSASELSPTWIWQDGNYFLSPMRPSPDQDVIDITSGEIVTLPQLKLENLSPNGRYAAQSSKQTNNFDAITIIDQETGLETTLYNPFQEKYPSIEYISANAHWSPEGNLLAVQYTIWHDQDNYDHDLAIHTPSGELFRQYSNMDVSFYSPWRPGTPNQILVTKGDSYFAPPPCILDIVENQLSCLDEVTEWIENVPVWNFIWSPDGSKVSFNHWRWEEPSNNGVCFIEITTKDIACPITTDDLLLEKQMIPRVHFWSPDGRYLALFFDEVGPIDVLGDLGVAIVKPDGQEFQILGQDFSWPGDGNPWRPAIPQKGGN